MSFVANTPSSLSDGIAWLTQPYRLLRERHARFGDVFDLELGRYGRYTVFADPDDIREIFAADGDTLHAGQGNAVLRSFLGAGSLLLLEGDAHRQERKLLRPAFIGQRLASHARTIEEVTRRHMATLEPGQRVQMHALLQRLTLDLIVGVVFGELPEARGLELKQGLASFLDDPKFNLATMDELDGSGSPSPTWRAFTSVLTSIRSLLSDELQRRRASRDVNDDVLSMLLEARYEDGSAMSDSAIVDELLTTIVTGYETTATGLAWALYATHRDPSLLLELRTRSAAIEPSAAMKDPFIQALVREVLRRHPVIPIVARRVMKSFSVRGRELEVGSIVAPAIYLVHHRASLYPEPDEFRPSRFLERTYGSHEYLPFGGGERRCIGMGLAWLELAIGLVTIVQSVELELLDGERVLPRRRSVTVGPSNGTEMRVLSKRTQAARIG